MLCRIYEAFLVGFAGEAGAVAALARTTGFTTRPVRMQRVQARTRLLPPLVAERTLFKLRCHFRLVTLLAWLTRCPDLGVFPQNSQCWAMVLAFRKAGSKK